MDVWDESDAYEDYMGRWSRPMAREFLAWLAFAESARWLDVGCGTGALTGVITEMAKPKQVSAIDPSPGYIAAARLTLGHVADFRIGDARSLPFEAGVFDIVVSGLMLNFVPEPEVALGEMRRVARAGGLVAVYVWDYAEGMEMIRRFWDAALAIDPTIGHLDEAVRFPLCRPESLLELFEDSGLSDFEATALEIPTRFGGFDEYWSPFEGGQGPAPGYVASLPNVDRDRLRQRLERELTTSSDGSIDLKARAWALSGVV